MHNVCNSAKIRNFPYGGGGREILVELIWLVE